MGSVRVAPHVHGARADPVIVRGVTPTVVVEASRRDAMRAIAVPLGSRRPGPTRLALAAIAIVALTVLGPSIASAQAGPLQAQAVVTRTYEAVVQVRTRVGTDRHGQPIVGFGSGTIISPAGFVLTNHHVVADRVEGTAIALWRQDSAFAPVRHAFDASYVAGDPRTDLAVLRIDADVDGQPLRTPLAFFPIGDFLALEAKITDRIDLFGFPHAGGQSITTLAGTLSGFKAEFDVAELFRLSAERRVEEAQRMIASIPAGDAWIKTDARGTGGISGGAALNHDGVLIGVPTITLGELRLLRPAIHARPLLRDVPGVVYIAAPATDRAEPRQDSEPPPSPEPSILSITSVPAGASVIVDDRTWGQTPLDLRFGSTGNYDVTLRLDGYDDHTSDVTIGPGRQHHTVALVPRGPAADCMTPTDYWSNVYVLHTILRVDGGTVRLCEGVFEFPGTMDIGQDTTIIGAGRGRTVLRLRPGARVVRGGVIEVNRGAQVEFRDLTIEGNGVGADPRAVVYVFDGDIDLQDVTLRASTNGVILSGDSAAFVWSGTAFEAVQTGVWCDRRSHLFLLGVDSTLPPEGSREHRLFFLGCEM